MKTNYSLNLVKEHFILKAGPVVASPHNDAMLTRDKFEQKRAVSTISTNEHHATASLIDTIAALFSDPIVTHRPLGGGENFVYLINDQWIFRIPKKEQAIDANRREQIVLKELNASMKSTQIPRYSFWDHERGIGGYKEIKGSALSFEFYNSLGPKEKSILAHDLALAISELHDLPLKKTAFLKNAKAEANAYIQAASDALGPQSIFAKPEIEKINEALGTALALIENPHAPQVVVHGDLHCDNILVDPATKGLSGIIDFAEARIGSPVIDFANLYRVNPQLAEMTATNYARCKNIDPQTFLKECRAWSIIWQVACISQNYRRPTLREQKRVIRAGKALTYLLELTEQQALGSPLETSLQVSD